MALRWNSQTNQYEDVGALVGNYNGTNVTQSEYDSIKNSGVGGLANSVVADNGNQTASLWQGFKDAFTPQGAAGTSLGGNVAQAVGTVGNLGLAGLAAYTENKSNKLKEDAYKANVARQAKIDAAGEKMASNIGNSASYDYTRTVG